MQIFKSLVVEFSAISKSNLKLYDKLNHINISTSSGILSTFLLLSIVGPTVSSQAASFVSCSVIKLAGPSMTFEFVIGINCKSPASLFVVPVVKFFYVFSSRLCPHVTTAQIKHELFNDMDVTITQTITRHPSYMFPSICNFL